MNNPFLNPLSHNTGSINLIVAIGEDGAIGKNGDLIWKIPEDLKRFKSLTTGHPVIMGRKTWESLPKRPLPNRRNIVITHQKNYVADGAEVVNSVSEAIDLTREEEPFIIGGAEIYKTAMPYITHFHLTKIFSKSPEADTHLTLPENLKILSSSSVFIPSSESSLPSYQFVTLTNRD